MRRSPRPTVRCFVSFAPRSIWKISSSNVPSSSLSIACVNRSVVSEYTCTVRRSVNGTCCFNAAALSVIVSAGRSTAVVFTTVNGTGAGIDVCCAARVAMSDRKQSDRIIRASLLLREVMESIEALLHLEIAEHGGDFRTRQQYRAEPLHRLRVGGPVVVIHG